MRTYSDRELRAFEEANSLALPAPLRAFLQERGAGVHGITTIYEPERVYGRYRDFFDDPSLLLSLYLPFGEKAREQEMLVYRVSDGSWAAIWHETVPDDWPDEDWKPFTDEALKKLVS